MADYTNSLGVNALTLDDINKQYGINASKDYAQQLAQKQLDSQLAQVAQQKQNYEQNAYNQSRQTDLDYFDQFRESQYNTAGKGMTAGLAERSNLSLNLGRNTDLSNIYNSLAQQNSGLDNQANDYRTQATTYADQLYQTNLQKAQSLIDSDFSKRLGIAQEEYSRKMEAERIQRELEQQAWERQMAEQQLALSRRGSGGGGTTATKSTSMAGEVDAVYGIYQSVGDKAYARRLAEASGYSLQAIEAVFGKASTSSTPSQSNNSQVSWTMALQKRKEQEMASKNASRTGSGGLLGRWLYK